MKYRLSIVVAVLSLCIAVASSVQADMVPTLDMHAISGDSDIDHDSIYLMAVNFWNQNDGQLYNVNGVNFMTITGNAYTTNGITLTYGNFTTGEILYNGGNNNNIGTGNIQNVLKGMIYNNAQQPQGTIDTTLTGLTPGKRYTYTIYARNWEGGTSDNRKHTYSFYSSGNDTADSFVQKSDNATVTSFTMSEDQPASYWTGLDNTKPYLIEYTFTAPEDGVFTVRDMGLNQGQSWHFYGMSLKDATPNVVKNGGFEADTFVSGSDQHGYADKHGNAITNWTLSNPSRIGLAPEWGDANRTSQKCGDFINSTQASSAYLPDGSKQAVFLQTDASISQNITLEPGTEYVLSYYTSARTAAAHKDPKYSVNVDGTQVFEGLLLVNQFDRNKFTYNEIRFTAQNSDTSLIFSILPYSDAGSSDRALLLDNVQIVKASDYVAPTIEGTKHDPYVKIENAETGVVYNWMAKRWNSEDTASYSTGYLTGAPSDYSHAFNFGETADRPMTTEKADPQSENKSLTFHGVLAGGSNQQLTGNISLLAGGNSSGGFTDSFYFDDNSRALAKSTSYNHDRIMLTGLEPGATYETTVFLRAFGTATGRNGYLTINGEKSPLINTYEMGSQNGGGLIVNFTGTADDYGVINIQVENTHSNDTLHLSGVSNRFVSASETQYNIPLQARFNKNDGSSVYGTTPETAQGQLASKTWVRRGNDLACTYQYDAKMIHNNGAAIDYKFTGERATASAEDILGTNYGASTITLSADLRVGSTTGTYSDNARGVGLGFFDSKAGTGNGEVGLGFAGLVLDANGNLYYFDKSEAQNSGHVQAVAWGTDKNNGGGAWSKDAWTNVAIDMELIDDGLKAKITGIHVVGSSADYSSLIGKVFNTTDMIGFSTSSTTGSTNGYVDNVQLIVREAATPETWNQKFEQYKADYIEQAGDTLASATSFRGENGTVIPGTKLDIIDTQSDDNVWLKRGMGSGNWNMDGSRTGEPQFTIIENQAKTSANSGIAAQWLKDGVEYLELSVDLQLGTLSGGDLQNARGLGLGLYDAIFGADQGEVGRGFSGIIVSPSGGLYYYDYSEDGLTRSDPIAFGGNFDKNEWYKLTMNLALFQEDDKLMATLTDVSLSGSTADYSDLIGRVFSNTDLIGLLSSSSDSWNNYGNFDNFRMNAIVPEPSTWIMLVLGAAGLLYMRKRK